MTFMKLCGVFSTLAVVGGLGIGACGDSETDDGGTCVGGGDMGGGGSGGDCTMSGSGPNTTTSASGGAGGNSSAGGNNAVGGSSAGCGTVNGSCLVPDPDPIDPDNHTNCTEYAGFTAAQSSAFETECMNSSQGQWSATGCEGRATWNFACQTPIGGMCSTGYVAYQETSLIAPAGTACTSAGGTVLIP